MIRFACGLSRGVGGRNHSRKLHYCHRRQLRGSRAGAAASDFVATVNWGDGNTQTLLVVADQLHPGQFDLICLSHLYVQLNQKFTVTVTISTVGKFGAVAGATASYVTTIVA